MWPSTPSVCKIGEKLGNFLDVGFLVNSGVRGNQESRRFGRLDSLDGFAEHAIALDANVVRLLQAVQMHVKEQAAKSA